MSAPARRVRRVRLRAPDEALARRGALLLEDALHTASLPGASEGRLVVIRRLDAGRIRPGAPPSSLALQIEARLRELERRAVHASAPAAEGAPAVWFRDVAEAASLLAVRLAAGAPADAWFWRAALPALRAARGAGEGIAAALRAAADSPAGPAAVAAVLAVARERGVAERLLRALPPAAAEEVLACCGWVPAAGPPAAASAVAGIRQRPSPGEAVVPAVAAEWAPLVARWVAAAGSADPRSALLAGAALVAARPARAADPALPARIAAVLAAAAAAHRPWSGAGPRDPDGQTLSREQEDRLAEPERLPSRPPIGEEAATRAVPVACAEEPRPSRAGTAADAGPISVDPLATPRRADEALPERADPVAEESTVPPATGGAGLFFLVPLLERLGFPEELARRPDLAEAELPRRVLLRVAERVRLPEDDPVRRLLADAREAPAPADAAARERAWVSALRRACRLGVRIGLHDLARRPGRIAATRTHLDLHLPLDAADVRIRAAGLDLDPGWVPWLGRVVAFHYGEPR